MIQDDIYIFSSVLRRLEGGFRQCRQREDVENIRREGNKLEDDKEKIYEETEVMMRTKDERRATRKDLRRRKE